MVDALAALAALVSVVAGVGAITGERTVASSIRDAAALCKAGPPQVGAAANGAVPVTLDVAGAATLQCLSQKLVDDRTFKGIDRVACDAPDRTVDLRCTLNVALADGAPRYGENTPQTWVLAILTAALENELDADRISILPDRIELAGELPSEDALAALEATAGKRGIAVRSLGLKVRSRPTLEALPDLAKGTGPAKLHVAGLAPASVLVFAGEAPKPFVAKADGAPVSGKIAAPSRVALAKALAFAVPVKRETLAASGASRKVTLSFQHAEASYIARVLSDAAGLNAAIPRGQPAVAVYARNTPVEPVQTALAKTLGLTRTKIGGIVYYTPQPAKVRAPAADEPRRTLNLGTGTTAAEALSLVSVIAKLPACLAPGTPLGRVRLKNVTPTEILNALQVMGGDAETDAAACTPAPPLRVSAAADLAPLTLLATLTGTGDSRALVRKPDGSVAWLEAGAGRVDVAADSAVLVMPSGERLALALEERTVAEALLADYRVVATLVSPQGSVALLEGRAGRTRSVANGSLSEGLVEILPGAIKLTEPGTSGYGYQPSSRELKLRGRRR